jgi:hypothetical protein
LTGVPTAFALHFRLLSDATRAVQLCYSGSSLRDATIEMEIAV